VQALTKNEFTHESDEAGCEPLLQHTVRELKSFATAINIPMSVVSLCWVLPRLTGK